MSVTVSEGVPPLVSPGWSNVDPEDPAAGPSPPADVPPTVTSLVPNTAQVGDPSFTLRVIGTGFTADSVIVFNGLDEPTTLVSETEVTTGVNMTVWTAPSAPLPVAVRTGAIVSNEVPFTFTAASAS
jgi:hypothetical protein